ncbi:hypothetical protein C2S52_015005 [Perilla frutescens var. hirtella]|nr:hypothetical protein C2S52_015005 [Perilla frutescens var. hirtella]
MDRLSRLPEESLSEILQRTSPADASRFAVISKRFKYAADSDIVWDRFLPSDWPEIVSRSVSPVVFATKKELYLSLFRSPILIDAGKLSFSLEKKSGKKCYMVGARELTIIWSRDPRYWDLTPHPDSRFSEVARLKSVCWLEIRSVMNMRMLSSNTIYGAYLVFKLADTRYGLESANAFVRFTNDDDERSLILGHFGRENGRDRNQQTGEVPVRIGDGLTEVALLHLQQQRANGSQGPQQQQTGKFPLVRGDGWMEVEMGSFYCDRGDDGTVETWFMATNSKWKSGLIVQGIEFRPKP